MAKRIIRRWDEERTALLDQDELFVIKGQGDSSNYFVWLQDQEIEQCPFCGNDSLRVQDLFPKSYLDIIEENGQKRVVSLIFQFYKYRCVNAECRHVFAKEIHFAAPNNNITYRLEDEIAYMVMQDNSYGEIAGRFSDMISRQAVGQIFNRWVHEKEEKRRIKTAPAALAVVSGQTDRDSYTLFLNLDDGIRVFDVLYGVSSSELLGMLRRIGLNNITTILSDCNPTIVDTINDVLPIASYIIPVQYWFKLVSEDFSEYSHDLLRWSAVRNKDLLIMLPESELGYRISDRNKLLETRPAIVQPYTDYNDLRDLINDRENPWTISDIDVWTTHVDSDFRSHLEATILRLNMYKDLIYQHELHRDLVPDKLFAMTSRLEELLSKVRTFSEAQLKARLLYSVPADLENWQGIPIVDVITALEEMSIDRRRNRNEYE